MRKKLIFELDNINGNYADVYAPDGAQMFTSWYFSKPIDQYPDAGTTLKEKIELSKILKLKEAGFDIDEIVKMYKEGIL